MNTKTTISISEARKRIFDLASEVQKPGIYYTFTEKGRPKAVLMSAEEHESWQETLEVMRDFPDLRKDAEETDRAVRSGEYKKWPGLNEIMSKYGYVVADKGKKNYVLEPKIRKEGSKKSR